MEGKKLTPKKGDNDLYGYVDENEKWVIEPKFDDAWRFIGEFALVELEGKYGFIKTDGTYLAEPKFDDAEFFAWGFAKVELEGKYGFIKTDGTYLVEPKFEEASEFNYNDVAIVKYEGKYGVIDERGNWIIPPKYDEAKVMKDVFDECLNDEGLFPFEDKIGYVELEGKKGYLKADGTYHWAPMSPKKDDKSELWGIVDKDGNWFVKPMYEDIKQWHDFMIIRVGEELRGDDVDITGIMDSNGIWILNPYWNVDDSESGEDYLEVWSDGEVNYFFPNGEIINRDDYYDNEEEYDEDED